MQWDTSEVLATAYDTVKEREKPSAAILVQFNSHRCGLGVHTIFVRVLGLNDERRILKHSTRVDTALIGSTSFPGCQL